MEPQRPACLDAVNLITVYLVLLFCIPANLIIGPLGSSGTPAQMFGLVAGGWWLTAKLAGALGSAQRWNILQRAMLCFLVAVVLSYIAATVRPIDAIEISASDRAILLVLSWAGIFFLASDTIPSRARLNVLLRRLVFLGGLLATVGIIQFITATNWVDQISIPGLTPNNDLGGVFSRSGFSRPSGTATHPIEFGVVIAMVLPIALHYALSDTHRSFLVRWYPVVAIAFAIPVSISRSAIVGAVVVFAMVLPGWPRSRRHAAYVAMLGFGVAVYLSVPGLIGTITGLFTGIAGDGSAQSRTDSYGIAWSYVEKAPLFGRGQLTFLPAYRILDNQYLLSLIEIGFFGTLSLLVLFGLGVWVGMKVKQLTADRALGYVGQALAACIAAGACSFATFDAFAFPLVSSFIFVVLGIVAAASRIAVADQQRSRPVNPGPGARGAPARRH